MANKSILIKTKNNSNAILVSINHNKRLYIEMGKFELTNNYSKEDIEFVNESGDSLYYKVTFLQWQEKLLSLCYVVNDLPIFKDILETTEIEDIYLKPCKDLLNNWLATGELTLFADIFFEAIHRLNLNIITTTHNKLDLYLESATIFKNSPSSSSNVTYYLSYGDKQIVYKGISYRMNTGLVQKNRDKLFKVLLSNNDDKITKTLVRFSYIEYIPLTGEIKRVINNDEETKNLLNTKNSLNIDVEVDTKAKWETRATIKLTEANLPLHILLTTKWLEKHKDLDTFIELDKEIFKKFKEEVAKYILLNKCFNIMFIMNFELKIIGYRLELVN